MPTTSPPATQGPDEPPAPIADESSTDDSGTDDTEAQPEPSPTVPVGASDAGPPGTAPSAPSSEPPIAEAGSAPPGHFDAGAAPVNDAGSGVEPKPMDAGQPAEPDECPDVAEQSERGSCGCGFTPHEDCELLETALLHRYSFDDEGETAKDSVGGAHATIFGTNLDGSGTFELDGDDAYAELPPGIISELEDATFEFWLRWDGGGANQRIFNFGAPGSFGAAPSSYVSVTPTTGTGPAGVMTFAYRPDEDATARNVSSDRPLPKEGQQHVVAVVDADAGQLSLYLNGNLEATVTTRESLEDLDDAFNYLGRPLYEYYPMYDGAFFEFRIYGVALTQSQVEKSLELGPDTRFSAP